jgi:Tol biopolymer transport system component/C-terminal processing protease CtpA/Prc
MPKMFRVALLCVLLVAAGAASAEEAQWMRYPAISPDGKTIAFSYRGDLWRVSSDGGVATPLTLHEAHDTAPVWSRDGSKIAFASDRYGNFDVWVIPAVGGEATRLTYHSAGDRPTSFTPDDKSVLFVSSRLDSVDCVQYPTGAQPELYAVSLDGGMPRQVLTTPAMYAVHDPSGQRLAYSDRKGYENEWRKHDNSSFARDVWVLDVDSGVHTRLTEFGYDDRQPVWAPDADSLFYLSEAAGSFNVWRLDLDDPDEPVQITTHDTHPVRFVSISSVGDIAYSYDGSLYVLRAGEQNSRRISVEAPADRRTNALQHLNVASEITEFDVSPDGKEIAFVARGEIFVTSTEHQETRRITDTPEQERSVSFGPKGRSLLYAGERNGSWNLYRSVLSDDDEPNFFNATAIEEIPVLEIEAETFQPAFSPDGKEVAYLEERTELKVINLDSGETRTILPGDVNYSYLDGDQWYQWSPDGQNFLVQFMSPTRWSNEVGLVPASGEGELVNLTRSGYEDYVPRWALEGQAMFWFTDRFGSRLQAGWPSEVDVRLAFLTREAWDRYRLSEAELEQAKAKEDEAKKDEKNGDDGKDDGKDDKKAKHGDDEEEDEDAIKLPDPVKLELDGLEDRIVRLTIHSSPMADAALTPDGERLLYLARFEKGFDLWSYEHRKGEIKLLAKLNAERAGDLFLDEKGEKAFLLVNGGIRTVEVASGKVTPVELSASMELDAAAERDYMFEHAWRQTLKKFHDVDMHGVDWEFYKDAYARFLPEVDTNWDFAELLSEMLGELNASHTGSGYRPNSPDADQTASLGFFPDPDWYEPGIRIVEILEKGPLTQAGTKITAGTVILAIDGHTIAAGENWYPLLNRKAGEPVRLTLSKPGDGESWEERVKPISQGEKGQLLYERWVRTRRDEVDRLSNDRIGYAHIRGMNDRAFRGIFEEIFGKAVDKEAIVLDTRFNGGGNLDEALTVFLSGEVFMRAVPRGQEVGAEPSLRWTKPSIVVQNEGNYSDAHCFPNAYRTLDLGKTVGTQVPGTCTAVWWERLQDRSLYFGIPEVTWVDAEGDPLENKHFDPDYWVDNDPELEAQGRDQQLEKAVEVLLDELGD